MSKGNNIIVTSPERGVRLEGIISGTDKPGTVMQMVAATEPIGGRFTWAKASAGMAADGDQRLIAVLLPDVLQGKTAGDAYVTGSRCFLYCPLPGETLNMLVEDVGGTGDDFAIGDLLEVDNGTGKLLATTSGESEPFVCLETVTNPLADHLMWCMFTGY